MVSQRLRAEMSPARSKFLKILPLIEHTTLEVAGHEAMLKSYEYLKALAAE